MREHSKKVNVLGIDVAVMRPDKAVNLSMDYMRRKGLKTIFFLSAESSLYCQSEPWAAKLIQSCPLILTGDRYMELAVRHQHSDGERSNGIGEFADEYLKRFLSKLNKENREIFAVMEKKEHMDSLEEYLHASYPDIYVKGIVFGGESKGEADKVINEINANIPDIVFFCLPVHQQMMFLKKYSAMINARLCICIESIQPLIRKETEEAPSLMRMLHLDHLWYHAKKDSLIKKTIVGSIFKKKVLDDTSSSDEEEDGEK